MPSNPRKAAYEAVLASLQNRCYAQQALEDWRRKDSPSIVDERFAQEIAYGAIRMASSLDYMAEQATAHRRLRLNVREKALLRTAVYQLAYMDRTASYAVVNESVKLAKGMPNPRFPSFLNALLRNLSDKLPDLPSGEDSASLALHYSYPNFFIEQLMEDFGWQKATQILSSGNLPPVLMARHRPGVEMEIIQGGEAVARYSASKDYYIQNATPAHLMKSLSAGLNDPKTLLDLCAAPGGKLVAAHDLFPHATLYANELSQERLSRLLENIKKYQLQVEVNVGPGEKYRSQQRFDLIILDVPCSNSGVLNKRPEARWRVNPKALMDLEKTQLALIENATKLLAPKGCLFYMTCSVLKQENQNLVQKACENFGISIDNQIQVLPDDKGNDGGYGCRLIL